MEHSPPPFFRRGPTPFVRLLLCTLLSVALLMAAETVEVIFRNEFLGRIEILRRHSAIIKEGERELDLRKIIEEVDQLARVFIR